VTLVAVVFLNLLDGVSTEWCERLGDGERPRWHVAITGSCTFLALRQHHPLVAPRVKEGR
jgi:hypothetical protein